MHTNNNREWTASARPSSVVRLTPDYGGQVGATGHAISREAATHDSLGRSPRKKIKERSALKARLNAGTVPRIKLPNPRWARSIF
jgi:hypothetical protein